MRSQLLINNVFVEANDSSILNIKNEIKHMKDRC